MAFTDDPDGDRFFALRTFRANGAPVTTAIWLAPADGRWYGYTPARSWKVRRIERDPRIEVARSTFDGTPTGAWQPGTARILPAHRSRVARHAMTAKYGVAFRIFGLVTLLGRFRRHGGRAVGLEIELAGDLPLLRR
jgi:PPOX class probable F420-dependent enzyme